MKTATALLGLFLCGCATTRVIPVEVKVPIPVPCIPQKIVEPVWPEKGANIYEKVRALIAEIELRKAYEQELKAAIAACEQPT